MSLFFFFTLCHFLRLFNEKTFYCMLQDFYRYVYIAAEMQLCGHVFELNVGGKAVHK